MSSWDDGLPDDAFTELERAAGVPSLMRSSSPYSPHVDEVACNESDATPDFPATLAADMVIRQVWGQAFDKAYLFAERESGTETNEDFYELDGQSIGNPFLNGYYIVFQDHGVMSARALVKAIKQTGIPFFRWADEALVWDEKFKRLTNVRLSYRGRASLSAHLSPLGKFLHRAKETSHHDRKPLLVRSNEIDLLLSGGAVRTDPPDYLDDYNVDNWVIAYYTNDKRIRYFEARDAFDSEFWSYSRERNYFRLPPCDQICTRAASFAVETQHRKASILRDDATMLVIAFAMLLTTRLDRLKSFRRRERATIFQPVYEPVSVADLSHADPNLLVTCGSHPLERNQFTSVDHLRRAMAALASNDIHIETPDSDRVQIVFKSESRRSHIEWPRSRNPNDVGPKVAS